MTPAAAVMLLTQLLFRCAAYLTPVEFEEYKNVRAVTAVDCSQRRRLLQVVKNRPLLVMSWIGKFVHQAYIDKYIQGTGTHQ